MKLEVPVLNQDGSVNFVASLTAGEVQILLQFGLNMAITAGLVSWTTLGDSTQLEMNFDMPDDATMQ